MCGIEDGIPPASFQEGMDRPHQSLSITLSNTWNKVPSERPTMFGLLSEIRYVKVLEVSTKGDESPGDLEDGSSTFPNASIATLSAFSEETDRHSGYNSSPSPNAGTTTKHYLPASNLDHYPLRPFSGDSINRRDTKDIKDGWGTASLDYIPPAPPREAFTSSRNRDLPPPPRKASASSLDYIPPAPRKDSTSSLDHVPPAPPREASISSRNRDLPPPLQEAPTSSLNHPPTRPVKRSTSASRALPIMPIMYMNEGPKLLRTGSEAGLAGIGASRKYHRRITSVVVPGVRNFADPYPSVSSPVVGFIGNESGRPPIAPKPLPPSQRNKVSNGRDLDDLPGGSTSYQNSGHVATRSWSGEQRGTGPTNSMATIMNDDSTDFHPLVAVEERFPYLQGPSARGSTGSVNSVHSNRLRFDPNEYVDPAFLVVTDLTEALEKRIGPPPLLPNEEPATSLVTKAAKRVSKVLRLGRYNK
ncbi:hypothetical protein CPB86DRAFT_789300 [Serendipita vermifera]|nr:hypothetical protein CPB86DRAFT_789300 [Serendipita vermifera]